MAETHIPAVEITLDDELVINFTGADLGGNPKPLNPNDPDQFSFDTALLVLAPPGDDPHQHILRPVAGLTGDGGTMITANVDIAAGDATDVRTVIVPVIIQAGAVRAVVTSATSRPRTDQQPPAPDQPAPDQPAPAG